MLRTFQDFNDWSRCHHRICSFLFKSIANTNCFGLTNKIIFEWFIFARSNLDSQDLFLKTLIPYYQKIISCFLVDICPILPKCHACFLVDIRPISQNFKICLNGSSSFVGARLSDFLKHVDIQDFEIFTNSIFKTKI